MASPTATTGQGHDAMATAPAPPNATDGTTQSRTIVTISVLLGVLFIIIMLIWWTSGKRQPRPPPPAPMPAVYRQVIKEKRKTAMPKSFVDSMPLVKYGTVMRVAQMDNMTDEEANICVKGKVILDTAKRSNVIPTSPLLR